MVTTLVPHQRADTRRLGSHRHWRVRPGLVAAAAFLTVLATSVLAGLLVRETLETRRQPRLDASIGLVEPAIEERLDVLRRQLSTTAEQLGDPAVIDEQLSQDAPFWRRDFNTELLSVALVQATPADEFNDAVGQVRSKGLDGFRVINAAPTDQNLLATFEGPGGRSVLSGVDLASTPEVAALLAESSAASTMGAPAPSDVLATGVLENFEFAESLARADAETTVIMAVGLHSDDASLTDDRRESGEPTDYWLVGTASMARLLGEVDHLVDNAHRLILLNGESPELDDRPTARATVKGLELAIVDEGGGELEPLVVVASGAAMSVVVAALIWSIAWSREGALGMAADQEVSRGRSQRKFEALVGNLTELIVIFSENWLITYVSPSVTTLLGRLPDDLVGQPASALLATDAGSIEPFETATAGILFECTLMNSAGDQRCFEGTITDLLHDPAVDGRVWTSRDITERRLTAERLEFDATHDHLTGLPNRTLLMDRLEQARQRARRDNTTVALLFLDIDRFKVINDSLGHASGDQLLVEVSRRLIEASRTVDTVARFGGDEFIIVCEDLAGADEAVIIAERLLEKLDSPLRIGDHETVIGASVGIAVESGDVRPDVLIRNADTAMYEAKARGRGLCQVFTEPLRSRAVHRLDMDASIRKAIGRDEFELHYQPIVELTSRRVVGIEGLLRWRHPDRGLLLPEGFLTIAEDAGLLSDLSAWVFAEAASHAFLWHAARPDDRSFFVSINVSAPQLRHPALSHQVTRLSNALAGSAVVDDDRAEIQLLSSAPTGGPVDLILELASSASLPLTDVNELVEPLRRAGARLLADDVGGVDGVLAHLRSGGFSGLKLARSYVSNLAASNIDEAIIRAVVQVADELDLDVYAKGVETEAQRKHLLALGCRHGQGHLFGAVATAEETARHLVDAAVRHTSVTTPTQQPG